MNIYSVRLIPHIKLKICEFFGIATKIAINQLDERLHRLDQRMDRFDHQLRRLHSRQVKLEGQKDPVLEDAKKKPGPPSSSSKSVAKNISKPGGKVEPKSLGSSGKVTDIREVASRKVDGAAKKASKKTAVLLIQPDAESYEAVRDYFGEGTSVKILDSVSQLIGVVESYNVPAVFFERTLLGNKEDRNILESLQNKMPETRFIGISNYLTLALTRAVPGGDDLFTFLTKPLSSEAFQEIFEEKGREAIS